MELFLQLWAGIFYLFNKIFFRQTEYFAARNKLGYANTWRIMAWVVYLVGLPAWVTIFVMNHNWIAAALECSGAPAMILGLVTALKGKDGDPPTFLNILALLGIMIGLCVSLWDFGGLTTLNQALELGIVAGFLIGTYLLARKNPAGYLFLAFMNCSNTILMFIEDYPWLVAQQVLSLLFVVSAYRMSKKPLHVHSA